VIVYYSISDLAKSLIEKQQSTKHQRQSRKGKAAMALSPVLQKLVSQAANKYSRSSGSRIKPKEGINRYRILVPDVNAQFWADLGVHWIKTELSDGAKPIAVVGCSDVVYGTPCAIDTAIDQAIGSAIDEDSKKLYESWRARKSVLVNVLDRSKGSSDPDAVQILELTPTTFGAIMGIVQQFAEEGEDVLDAKTGMDIAITRSGKGLNTEYTVNVAPGQSKPVTKAHLEACHNLVDHIAKEFFKGDENKALSVISQTAQINVPRLASKTPTAALTSKAASVPADDADDAAADLAQDLEEEAVEQAPVKAAAKTTTAARKPAPAPEPEEDDAAASSDDDDLADVLKDLDDL
jgi:hypothetical protein